MVQVPAVRPVMVLPLTVQTAVVVLVYVTGNPDVAVALAVATLPTRRVEGAKLIVPIV